MPKQLLLLLLLLQVRTWLLLLLLLRLHTLHEAHCQVLQYDAITARKERQHILDEVLLSGCTHSRRHIVKRSET